MNVYVTGLGIISSIGNDVPSTLRALKNDITGLKFNENFELYLGEVPKSNTDLTAELGLDTDDRSRTSLLSMVAAREAWGRNKAHPELRTGLISATSVGGMDRLEEYFWRGMDGSFDDVDPFLKFENGQTTEEVAAYLGISGLVGTISTACSSGVNAIIQGFRLIRAGKLDRVIVGGCDPLAKFDIKGFDSLGVYDKELCRPFDADRNGLNLGEGAAFLVLENEASREITANNTLATIGGWANTTDAYHQTASSPDGIGATLAMQNALKMANLETRDIDYINAHGTGTPNNDASESAAFRNVFGSEVPPISSTKGHTGHTLAAAGALESVFSVLSILHNAIWPNLRHKKAIPESGISPVTEFAYKKVRHVMSNSFGFGGNCSTILFSATE